MTQTSSQRRPSSRRRQRPQMVLPLWSVALLAVASLAFVVASSLWLFRTVQGMAASWETTESDPLEVDPENATWQYEGWNLDGPLVTSVAPGGEEQPGTSGLALQPWTGRERVTILLLGVDLRCEEEGPTHTDSLMVLTVDPVGLSAAALSLPRDLWVEIPGFGVDRINQAYFKGEVYDYPGGGAALAVETVEAALGVPIDYYAAVNFQAFVEGIDAIGGITVDVPEDIEDPSYPDGCYGYDPFYISAGKKKLDGATALKYARTRATLGGDVDRAGRQQQVAMAVHDQVLQLDMLPRLLAQAPQLWQSLQENVQTNMSLNEAIQLARLVQDIPRESIELAVIDYDYVYNETTPEGQQVLVPERDSIRALRDRLFAPPAVPTPIVEDLSQLMREERARVAIHNGTPVFGLAGDTETYLRRYGVRVVEIGNADASTYASTQIVDFGSHPSTTRYLAQVMEIPPLNVSYSNQAPGDYDVLLILGDDWRVP